MTNTEHGRQEGFGRSGTECPTLTGSGNPDLAFLDRKCKHLSNELSYVRQILRTSAYNPIYRGEEAIVGVCGDVFGDVTKDDRPAVIKDLVRGCERHLDKAERLIKTSTQKRALLEEIQAVKEELQQLKTLIIERNKAFEKINALLLEHWPSIQ